MKDIIEYYRRHKKLIDYAVSFAEKMLKELQEFFIFSVIINLNGDRIPTGYSSGDDNLSSQDLINKLQAHHDRQLLNKEIRAYSLTYLERVKKDDAGEMTGAIAVKIKHTETTDITIYYFAYRLTSQKKIEHLGNWSKIVK